jgi:hypothetical protein
VAFVTPLATSVVAFAVLGALVSAGLIGAAEAGAETLEMVIDRSPLNIA